VNTIQDGVARATRDGFAEFVTTRSPVLLRTAWLLTGARGRAEDLVQESLTGALRA
jgi:DNA-directed RNA polymerase specialized sigma24 family protein